MKIFFSELKRSNNTSDIYFVVPGVEVKDYFLRYNKLIDQYKKNKSIFVMKDLKVQNMNDIIEKLQKIKIAREKEEE